MNVMRGCFAAVGVTASAACLGQLGYRLMAGGEEGMSPAELRALPVVIHEKPVRSRTRTEGRPYP